MTDLRDAARQALEALKSVQDHKPNYETNAAITALRAALEQHEKDVEWMKQRHANWRLQKELAEQTQERDRQQRKYEESRSAALEQPEEPVAWVESPHGAIRANPLYRITAPQSLAWSIPLFTHSPRREWRGLTEEEIQSIHDTYHKRMGPQEFARAIEAALKERNL